MSQEYLALIEECRQHCLWFLEPRAVPTDREGQFFTLECVERYGRRSRYIDLFHDTAATVAASIDEVVVTSGGGPR